MEPDITTELGVFFAGLQKGQLISAKLNLTPDQEEIWEDVVYERFDVLKRYLSDNYGSIMYSSVGLHRLGKNGVPHIHFHFITDKSYESITSQARSNRKTRWLKDEEPVAVNFIKDCSFMHKPFDAVYNPWSFLSYPLKEGHKTIRLCYYIGITSRILGFLLSIATTIYETQMAVRDRNDKAQQRRDDALDELEDWARDQRKKGAFETFREMQEHFEDLYLSEKMEKEGIHGLPDVVNYNKNLKKVGKRLGIFRFCDDASAK